MLRWHIVNSSLFCNWNWLNLALRGFTDLCKICPQIGKNSVRCSVSYVFSDMLRRHLKPVICIENAIAEQVYSRSKQDFADRCALMHLGWCIVSMVLTMQLWRGVTVETRFCGSIRDKNCFMVTKNRFTQSKHWKHVFSPHKRCLLPYAFSLKDWYLFRPWTAIRVTLHFENQSINPSVQSMNRV